MIRTLLNGAALAVAFAVTDGNATAAIFQGGQYPAPPVFANHLALPDCGFAAADSSGPNGFQYCDPRMMYRHGNGRDWPAAGG